MVKSVCIVSDCGGWVASKGLCPKHHGVYVGTDGSVCTVSKCTRGEYGKRGWCKKHYNSARKQGLTGRGLECSGQGCGLIATSKGLCDTHRRIQRRETPDTVCTFEECNKLAEVAGLCNGHVKQRNRGETLTKLKRSQNLRGVWGDWYLSGGGYIERHRITEDGVREYQKQHRYVKECQLGRPLLPNENIHHKNGVRGDNRIENLERWITPQPSGQRIPDKIRFALEIIALYGDDPSAYDEEYAPIV